jgi:hypothetical protein
VPAPRFEHHHSPDYIGHVPRLTPALLNRSGYGYNGEDMSLGMVPTIQPGITPPLTPGVHSPPSERPQTTAYALCDSPPGLLAYILDIIRPPTLGQGNRSPSIREGSSAGNSPMLVRSPSTPYSATNTAPSTPGPGRSPSAAQSIDLPGISTVWTPTVLINWTMIYWLPGPEVALRWVVNSAALLPSLWLSYCNVPLGITHFRDPMPMSTGTGQTPPQWAEAYHRVAMLNRREGRVRHPAWERPMEVVMDIRELAGLVFGNASGHTPMVPNMQRAP